MDTQPLPDPVCARVLSENRGDVKATITRLVTRLRWEREEAEAEIAKCLRSCGVQPNEHASN